MYCYTLAVVHLFMANVLHDKPFIYQAITIILKRFSFTSNLIIHTCSNIILILQQEHCGTNFDFVYAQVFQNITIPISGIPKCQFNSSNSDTMSPICELSLFKFEDV